MPQLPKLPAFAEIPRDIKEAETIGQEVIVALVMVAGLAFIVIAGGLAIVGYKLMSGPAKPPTRQLRRPPSRRAH